MNDVDRMISDRLKTKATLQRELAARPVSPVREVLDVADTSFADRCVRFSRAARDRLA